MDCQATSSFPFPHGDLAPRPAPPSGPAQGPLPARRQDLAIQALGATHPVADSARRHQLGRELLYQQAAIARHALTRAFEPEPPADQVPSHLPVTEARLRRRVLAPVPVGHRPYRAVVESRRDLFDCRMAPGTVPDIVARAVGPARAISRRCHPAGARIGAHDEILQASRPVLVGAGTASTYCSRLGPEGHRDAETWGARLLGSVDQGSDPDAIVADAGTGPRAGQVPALPAVPCRGDVFHVLGDPEAVSGSLGNRALEALGQAERRRRQCESARRHDRRGRAKSLRSAARLLSLARVAGGAAVALAHDVALLIGWLRHDTPAVAGPCHGDRRARYDLVVAELKGLAPRCPHRLGPIRRQLENQGDDPPALAHLLDAELERLGEEFQVPGGLPRRFLRTLARDDRDPRRWAERSALRARLRGRSYEAQAAVAAVAAGAVRASSRVETLNSRLRSYFSPRRHPGSDYLALLPFFLNHRRLGRGDRPERVGETPAELLTGKSHPPWLERPGDTRFRRGWEGHPQCLP